MTEPLEDALRALAVEPQEWTRAEAAEQRRADRMLSVCSGKVGHPDERAARHASWLAGWATEPYECEFCEKWHTGGRQ